MVDVQFTQITMKLPLAKIEVRAFINRFRYKFSFPGLTMRLAYLLGPQKKRFINFPCIPPFYIYPCYRLFKESSCSSITAGLLVLDIELDGSQTTGNSGLSSFFFLPLVNFKDYFPKTA